MEDKRFIEDTYEIIFTAQQSQFKPSSEYLLTFKYTGQISTGTHGVFTCIDPRFKKIHKLGVKNLVTIEDEEMKNKIIENSIICVQSEPAYARYLLPCFDEPSMKATFKCKVLVTHKSHIALSNTEGKEEATEEGRWFHFTESPKMCTYLICIVVGKFDYHEVKTKRGIKIRGYTPEGQADQVQDHVEIAADAVDLYEEYFGIPYPLEKLDFVSFHNHMVRAMENWGIITIKNDVILNHPDYTSSKTIQRNSRTVAHEVSHMWFGNHVSPEWWDVIWLNEGFARYAEHQILNKIRPNFRIWDKYMFEVYGAAIRADKQIYSTHPVHVPVPEPNKLMSIFDTISYAKGSAICRMLNGIINDDNIFQQALKEYMVKYAGKCTITEDLLDVFEKVSSKPIKSLLLPWIEQPCFPEVLFKRVSDTEFEVEQRCFKGQSESIWPIYIRYSSGKGIVGEFTMLERQQKIKIEGLQKDDIVKFNQDHRGFFICKYEKDYQELLIKNNLKFSNFDRFGILFDYIELYGKLQVEDLVQFKEETSIGAWSLMYQSFNKILSQYLKNPSENESEFKIARDIIYHNFQQILKQEDIDYQLLHLHLMFLGIGCIDEQAIQFCLKEFKDKFDPQTLKFTIDNDIRFPVYCLAAYRDDQCAQVLRNYYDQKKQFFTEYGLSQEMDNVFYAILLSRQFQFKKDLVIGFFPSLGSDFQQAYLRLNCLAYTQTLEKLSDQELKSVEFKEFIQTQNAYLTRFYGQNSKIDFENSQLLLQIIDQILGLEEFKLFRGFDTVYAQLNSIVNPPDAKDELENHD